MMKQHIKLFNALTVLRRVGVFMGESYIYLYHMSGYGAKW